MLNLSCISDFHGDSDEELAERVLVLVLAVCVIIGFYFVQTLIYKVRNWK